MLARYGHVVDNAAWDELASVFTADVEVETPGGTAHGRAELQEWYSSFPAATGTPMPAHHVVNVLLRRATGGTVRAWSRFLLVGYDQSVQTGDHADVLVRTAEGWRVHRRRIRPRNLPDGDAEVETFRSWLDD